MRSAPSRWIHASACWLLLSSSAHALALTVVVERLPDGAVRVDYELEEEVTELVVNMRGPSAAFWQVLGDSLTLRDGRIASVTGSPFATASVRIEPAPLRGYVRAAVASLGPRSSVVNLALVLPPAMAGSTAVKLRNAFDVDARACVDEYVRRDVAELSAVANWFVAVATTRDACRELLHDGAVQVLAEDAPAPLLQSTQAMRASYVRLAAKLGRPLDPPPTLILSYAPGSAGGFNATQAGIDSVVLARVEGESWAAPTERQTGGLTLGFTTALARAWLDLPEWGLVSRSAAARYLAVLDRHGAGDDVLGEPAGRMLLADLADCGRRPGSGPAGSGGPDDRADPACGLLVQFAYDAAVRAESAGRRTIFDIWSDVLADADGAALAPESFLVTNERARAAVAGLAFAGSTPDFKGLVELLRESGIDAAVGDPRDTGGAVAALVRALVREDCGRRGGTGIKADRIVVDMREPCRTLPQQFEIIEIEDVGVLTSARAVHDAVAGACAARGRVAVTGALPQQQFELRCPASVPALPQQLYLRDVYFLK